MSTTSGAVHPLFDENSEYRRATLTSVWHDDGTGSIVKFFQDRARQTGDAVGAELDRPIDNSLEAPQQEVASADKERESSVTGEYPQSILAHGKRTDVGDAPLTTSSHTANGNLVPAALLCITLGMDGSSSVVEKPLRDPQFFTGCGGDPTSSDTFSLDVPGLPRNRRWVALLLEPERLNDLKSELWPEESENHGSRLPVKAINGDQDAVRVISEAVSHETLTPQGETRRERASRISKLLSLAPALQGTTGADGKVNKQVSFGASCPLLASGSWVVLCLEPEEKPESKEEKEEREERTRALIANYFCRGISPTKIRELMRTHHDTTLNRTQVWTKLSKSAENDRLRYVPEENTGLCEKLKKTYEFAGLDRLKVVGSVAISDLAFRTAQMLLEILREHYKKRSQQEVHIGFAGGGMLLETARALRDLLREPEGNERLPRRLVFHSMVAGWNVEQPEKDPNSFSAVLAEDRSTSDFDIRFVGLHAPGIVPMNMFASLKILPGIKDAFDAASQIDIIVTSAGRWKCEHSSLWQLYSTYSKSTLKELQNAGCIGDLMWCPIGRAGEIPRRTSSSLQSFTLMQIEDLHDFICDEGKHVLLVLGPCSVCGETKTEIFRTIASLAPNKRFVNHLVCDSLTARQLIREATDPPVGIGAS